MNNTSIFTTKGQVVIPKNIRDQFDLKPSDKVVFIPGKSSVVLRKAVTLKDIRKLFASKKTRTTSHEKIDVVIQESVVKKYLGKSKNGNT